jgi:hypothetical protein
VASSISFLFQVLEKPISLISQFFKGYKGALNFFDNFFILEKYSLGVLLSGIFLLFRFLTFLKLHKKNPDIIAEYNQNSHGLSSANLFIDF